MTYRERVRSALLFQTPDKVPYHIGLTGQAFDKVAAYTGDADFMAHTGNHMSIEELCLPQVEIRPGYWRDEFGVVWNKTGVDKDIGVIDSILIEDITAPIELPPVDEAFVRARMERLMQEPEENFKIAMIGFSLFERAWTMRGMENLLCDMLTEPEATHALFDKICERNMQLIKIALEYPIDCFHFGDDWGQQRHLIMGPKLWREFIKPRLAKMYGLVHEKGLFVSQHSCGDIREVMEDLHEIGLNMYQTFQPEIYGLDYAKEVMFGKITVWGGISTQADLPCRTPDEIRQITRELLAAFPHGGLVAAPTHAVPGDVPPENILAMLEVLQNQA